MHEPTIAAALIELAQKELVRAGAANSRVTSLTVKIGALRSVVEDSLQFAFATLRANTPLETATLIVEKCSVVGVCRSCGASFQPQEPLFLCAQCGSGDIQIDSGNELDLVEMIVE